MKYTLQPTHTYRHGDYVASLVDEEQIDTRYTYRFHVHHTSQPPNEHPTHYLTIDRFDRLFKRGEDTEGNPRLYHLRPDLTVVSFSNTYDGLGDSMTLDELKVNYFDAFAYDPNHDRRADYETEFHYCMTHIVQAIVHDLDRQAMEDN